MSQFDSLRDFYVNSTGTEQNVFDIWENGGAQGDSVTPSTYSGAYRLWMRDLLRKFLTESDDPGLLSIGCGNAAVETGLVKEGFRVLGVDALQEAVDLARAKGVDAVCADIFTWMPPPGPWNVIYADGLFGHLYDPVEGVRKVMDRLRSWLPAGGTLVISNDGPRGTAEVETHPDVRGFTWLSRTYLRGQVEESGFQAVSSTHFTYERPLSGQRDRVIVTGRT